MAISNDKLGLNIAETLDLLSRNALLNVPFHLYGPDGAYTSFAGMTPADTLRTGTIEDIHLSMAIRDVPYTQNPSGDIGSIVALTSPGVIFDIRRQTDPKDWLYRAAYARPMVLWNYEIGTFQNVRFVVTPKMILWNCGDIQTQTTVTAPIQAGDGSPSGLVDNTIRSGQAGATHYIQCGATDLSNIAVNSFITIHTLRSAGGVGVNGVVNGVDYTDGTVTTRRVITVDNSAKRIAIETPVMIPFTTDLGGGVYAYVTQGIHIHATTFIGGPDAVVAGVGRPLELLFPPVVDDTMAMFRAVWTTYMGFNNYNPKVAQTVFTAGSVIGVSGQIQ